MLSIVAPIVERLRPVVIAASRHASDAWRERRRLSLLALAIAALVPLLLIASCFQSGSAAVGSGETVTRSEAQFLVVCGKCDARQVFDRPPAKALRQERGLLRCPACHQFAAGWYRRGGSAIPPGGW